jgi:hypothetical protein
MKTNTYLYRACPNQMSGVPDMAASALRKRHRDPAKIQLIGSIGNARTMVSEYLSTKRKATMHLTSGASPTEAAQSSENGGGDVVLSWSKVTAVGSKGERPYELKQAFTYLRMRVEWHLLSQKLKFSSHDMQLRFMANTTFPMYVWYSHCKELHVCART